MNWKNGWVVGTSPNVAVTGGGETCSLYPMIAPAMAFVVSPDCGIAATTIRWNQTSRFTLLF